MFDLGSIDISMNFMTQVNNDEVAKLHFFSEVLVVLKPNGGDLDVQTKNLKRLQYHQGIPLQICEKSRKELPGP